MIKKQLTTGSRQSKNRNKNIITRQIKKAIDKTNRLYL